MRALLVLVALATGLLTAVAPAGPARADPPLPNGCVRQSYELNDRTARERCEGEYAQTAREDAEFRAYLAELRSRPPLPAAQNRLIGRWQAPAAPRAAIGAELLGDLGPLSELGEFLGRAEAGFCALVFGGGQVEFSPERWAVTDRSGRDDRGPVAYRAIGPGEEAVLTAKGLAPLIRFQFVDANRVRVANDFASCELRRIGPGATLGGAVRPIAPASPGGGRPAPRQTYDPPTPVYDSGGRPPDEVCRRVFVDELGKARVETVREILKARYKETQAGVTPGAQTLRLAARGSPCEEASIDAVWYDFDAGGVLRRVTQVWRRQAGFDPYAFLSTQIGRLATAPPRVTGTGRTEGATAIYRYLIEDRPQQQAVVITYTPLTP